LIGGLCRFPLEAVVGIADRSPIRSSIRPLSRRLLLHMCRLMGKQVQASGGRRGVASGAEEDVPACGEGGSIDCLRQLIRFGVRVHPYLREVAS
jgi:hypothetical protein